MIRYVACLLFFTFWPLAVAVAADDKQKFASYWFIPVVFVRP
jgi:hypothetical protein